MLAAVYVRVSTEEQAFEGYSLEAQKDILLDYCTAEDWQIFDIYVDDGYSGTNISRPAYAKMMNDIDSWDVMVVVKMDRIHRNSRNFMNMMDILNKKNKMFVSSTESLDTTHALGRFVVDMIQRIAQLESEQIGERTYIGMKEKAETMDNTPEINRTMGFNPPFGYSVEDGMLVSVDEELETVSEIFGMYLDGRSMGDIAYNLNCRSVLTRRGNPWNVYNLRVILHNPIYAGFMRWDGVLIRHYAFSAVTPDEFNSVQKLMSSKAKTSKTKETFLVPDTDFL